MISVIVPPRPRSRPRPQLPINLQPVEAFNIEGFIPVIINIVPVDVQLLLGLADDYAPFKSAANEEPEKLSHFEPVNRLKVPSLSSGRALLHRSEIS